MFQQVMATLFQLMTDHVDQWMSVTEINASVMFGFGMGTKEPPELIPTELARLHHKFRTRSRPDARSCVWRLARSSMNA